MAVNLGYRDGIAQIVLDREPVLNALSFAILTELGAAFDDVGQSKARALVITGAGTRAFCAGADIQELRDRTLHEELKGLVLGQQIMAKLDGLSVPSIAVINGYAFGGGLELAMACTFRLALPNAKMGLPEIKLGLIPGYGGTQRLPRLIGEAKALEMVMTGRTIDAVEAERIGLVNGIVEGDAMAAGVAFARQMTDYSLPVLNFARAAVRRARGTSLADGLASETELATLAYRTRDASEGMAAFVEKRRAEFSDA